VEVFHVDEYVGISSEAPASFRRWVRRNFVERVHPGQVHYLNGDAGDADAECRRYAELLSEARVDLALLGIGENGHIGFNDPHEADFDDPYLVRPVTLDDRCRMQQYTEDHFPDLALVPEVGLTLTCPALMSADAVVCTVPGPQKAEAVQKALELTISESCPGSILRVHRNASLFLDSDSASRLARRLTTDCRK
jgi:glucosamine-6-phosphate deaminase